LPRYRFDIPPISASTVLMTPLRSFLSRETQSRVATARYSISFLMLANHTKEQKTL
jgi:hypothetical protein